MGITQVTYAIPAQAGGEVGPNVTPACLFWCGVNCALLCVFDAVSPIMDAIGTAQGVVTWYVA